jgi:hypothetical protein
MDAIDASYDGRGVALFMGVRGLAKSLLNLVIGLVSRGEDKIAQAVLDVTHYVGRVAGSAGFVSRRYG